MFQIITGLLSPPGMSYNSELSGMHRAGVREGPAAHPLALSWVSSPDPHYILYNYAYYTTIL